MERNQIEVREWSFSISFPLVALWLVAWLTLTLLAYGLLIELSVQRVLLWTLVVSFAGLNLLFLMIVCIQYIFGSENRLTAYALAFLSVAFLAAAGVLRPECYSDVLRILEALRQRRLLWPITVGVGSVFALGILAYGWVRRCEADRLAGVTLFEIPVNFYLVAFSCLSVITPLLSLWIDDWAFLVVPSGISSLAVSVLLWQMVVRTGIQARYFAVSAVIFALLNYDTLLYSFALMALGLFGVAVTYYTAVLLKRLYAKTEEVVVETAEEIGGTAEKQLSRFKALLAKFHPVPAVSSQPPEPTRLVEQGPTPRPRVKRLNILVAVGAIVIVAALAMVKAYPPGDPPPPPPPEPTPDSVRRYEACRKHYRDICVEECESKEKCNRKLFSYENEQESYEKCFQRCTESCTHQRAIHHLNVDPREECPDSVLPPRNRRR